MLKYIDSHAHYSHSMYDGDFSYLDWQQGDFCIRQGNRRMMLEEMARRGISFSIEAGVLDYAMLFWYILIIAALGFIRFECVFYNSNTSEA